MISSTHNYHLILMHKPQLLQVTGTAFDKQFYDTQSPIVTLRNMASPRICPSHTIPLRNSIQDVWLYQCLTQLQHQQKKAMHAISCPKASSSSSFIYHFSLPITNPGSSPIDTYSSPSFSSNQLMLQSAPSIMAVHWRRFIMVCHNTTSTRFELFVVCVCKVMIG